MPRKQINCCVTIKAIVFILLLFKYLTNEIIFVQVELILVSLQQRIFPQRNLKLLEKRLMIEIPKQKLNQFDCGTDSASFKHNKPDAVR